MVCVHIGKLLKILQISQSCCQLISNFTKKCALSRILHFDIFRKSICNSYEEIRQKLLTKTSRPFWPQKKPVQFCPPRKISKNFFLSVALIEINSSIRKEFSFQDAWINVFHVRRRHCIFWQCEWGCLVESV